MLVFQCPSCKAKMQAAEAHAGKKVASSDPTAEADTLANGTQIGSS